MPVKGILQRLYEKILWRLHLTNQPVVRVYNGYGNRKHLIIYGHVFKFSPVPRKKFRGSYVINAFAVLRSFMVKPWQGAKVVLIWGDQKIENTTATDGFFKFEWAPGIDVKTG